VIDISGGTDTYRRWSLRAGGVALLCTLVGMVAWTGRAVAGGAPGLPGPPPNAGSGFPLPPAAGQAPAPAPAGPPATIPTQASGPGLLSGTARLRGTAFSLPIACHSGGRVSVSAPTLASGTLAQAQYACRGGRANLRVALPAAVARRIAGLGEALARLTFGHGRTAETLSLTLETRAGAATFWNSDLGLRCAVGGPDAAELLAPNFTDTPVTTIDVRPWLAWYTSATGWQWLGTRGANASRWYRWTATPSGVAEWQTPPGAITPWTWSPISVQPGHGTYVIAVFEAIYWYSHPIYVWSYARSGAGANAVTTYCGYR
jgi:hypothetical protein